MDFYRIPVENVLEAYKKGLFPMAENSYSKEIFWVDPEIRGVIKLNSLVTTKKFKKTIKKKLFELAIDNNFEKVINLCAEKTSSREDTWINNTIKQVYISMYESGYAHSVECYKSNKLVGGLYGVSIGGVFYGESMFSRETNASKYALVHLIERLIHGGYQILDTQFINEHLRQFGAIEMKRDCFKKKLREALKVSASFFKFSKKGFIPENKHPSKNNT